MIDADTHEALVLSPRQFDADDHGTVGVEGALVKRPSSSVSVYAVEHDRGDERKHVVGVFTSEERAWAFVEVLRQRPGRLAGEKKYSGNLFVYRYLLNPETDETPGRAATYMPVKKPPSGEPGSP